MKYWSRVSFWFMPFVLLPLTMMVACSGGGGGGALPTISTPSIAAMTLSSTQTGTLSVSLDFTDAGGDVATISGSLYDAHLALLGADILPIQGAQGITSGIIQGEIDFSFLPFGDYSLAVYLTDSAGLRSNTLSGTFSAIGSFGKSINYPSPLNYLSLGDTAIGDLNGDGLNDVASIQGVNNTGLLLIYYQNASGGLDSAVTVTLTIQTRGVAVADVNNDGRQDLILSGLSQTALTGYLGRVVLFLQDPATGQLGAPQEYTVSSNNVYSLVVGDLNGDGRNDVVVMVEQAAAAGGLSFFFQNSDGTLRAEVVYDKVNVTAGEIHIADMDNNGLNDVVVQSGQKELSVIRQLAAGVTSTVPEQYSVQTSYWFGFSAFALGDVNGDGRADMVVVDPGNNGYINIFLQNVQGLLDRPVLVQITDLPFGVEVADSTGDGLNDIIMDVSSGIVVFPQQPDHTFGHRRYYPYYASSFGGSSIHQALSIGDVNGDGLPDAVVTWADSGLFLFPYAAELIVQ
jgi:hypothetical protein